MDDQPMDMEDFDRQRVCIRDILYADLAAIVELDAQVFGPPRDAYFAHRLAVLDHPEAKRQSILLAADYRGVLAGFIMGTLAYGEFGLVQVTAIVDSLAVHPRYQSKGIGRTLLEAFIRQGTQLGAETVYTLVRWDNWNLLKIFHALGFSMATTLPLERRIGWDYADRGE